MLPIITVGLTPASLAAIDRIPGDRAFAHYDTAEEALWDLPTDSNPTVSMIDLESDGERWTCHVIYGDDAIAALLTHTELDPRPTRVPVTGLVAVITDSLGDDQIAPRRVVDGTPESREITRSAVEAVNLLTAQAFLVVDQLDVSPGWPASVDYALNRAEERAGFTMPQTLDKNPGAAAARALRTLAARTEKGQPRQRGEGL